MRRYAYVADGDRFLPRLHEAPDPRPGPGEVVVRLRACSLNYRDLVLASGVRKVAVGGLTPLSDGAGEIAEIGAGVAGLTIGQRVTACFFRRWPHGRFDKAAQDSAQGGAVDGMLAELVALPAAAVVATPAHLSDEEAACLPCAGVTAWNALVTRGGVQAGQSVLTLGSGGVSCFAIQIASALKATVIATSGSASKAQRLRGLGATTVIDHRAVPDWDRAVREATAGLGVDHVVEVGGIGTLERSLRALAVGGHLALIGVLTDGTPPTVWPLVHKNATLSGIYVGSSDHLRTFAGFLAAHAIRPVIDRSFAYTEAAAAFDHLRAAGHVGKVVVRVG